MLDYEELIADTPPMDDAMRGYDDLACLFYTSGATGQPKGVMLSHANLVMNVMNTLPGYGYAEESVGLLAGPLFHLATGSRVFTAVFAMARQVVSAPVRRKSRAADDRKRRCYHHTTGPNNGAHDS